MQLLSAIQKWIGAIDFGSEAKNRLAQYLQGIFVIIIITTLILAANYTITGEAIVVGLLIGTTILFCLLLALVRNKYLEPARFIFVISSLLVLTSGLLLKNGMRSAGAFMYPVLIIFASVLLTRRSFAWYAMLILTSIAGIIYADSQGALLIQEFDPPSPALFITYGLMIFFTTVIIRFITENWQDSLKRSEQAQEELKQQKNLLEASEARWRTLVVHAPVLIATVNRAGIINYVNIDYFGQFANEDKHTVFEFINAESHPEARAALEQCFTTGKPSHYEMEAVGISLNPGWYSVGLGPVVENGQVKEVILIATDITPQKQAEAEVRQLNAELDQRVRERSAETEAAYRELEMFSHAMSHNLRTPARGMTGFAEMLLRDYAAQLDPSARNFLRKISTNAITMGLMIDDLLEFLQLGRISLKIRDVSPALLAENALESLPTYRDAHGITFTVDPMPRVNADAELLTRVYSNLLDNAIKFTRERKDPAIHIGVTQTSKGTTFFVRDNGIGFDMQYVGKLFGVFQQLHRPGEYEGTGVGLATVQRIIRRHGGHVWAEAEMNKGATFYFTL